MPRTKEFRPVSETLAKTEVILTVDEYETIRLIDREGFSQEECSTYMQVGRTTVQLIYNSARKKLATALVDGLPLRIEGGDYQLCDGKEEFCGCGGCKRHRHSCIQKKEDGVDTIVENPAAQAQGGAGLQAAQFLVDHEVDVLITVRCGQNAAKVFQEAGMKIYQSVNKAAADDLKAMEEGQLEELTKFHAGYHGVQ